jgi:hypothetical protein
MTLGDRVNLFAAVLKKSFDSELREINLSISLGVMFAFDEMLVHLNLSFWIDRAFITFFLMLSLLSHFVFSKRLSIFSLGISRIISILSINGHDIFD